MVNQIGIFTLTELVPAFIFWSETMQGPPGSAFYISYLQIKYILYARETTACKQVKTTYKFAKNLLGTQEKYRAAKGQLKQIRQVMMIWWIRLGEINIFFRPYPPPFPLPPTRWLKKCYALFV